jgi:hypothetical protein
VTGRGGRRRKQPLDDLKEKRGYWKLKEEALDRTMWRTRFGRDYGAFVRQITERISNILYNYGRGPHAARRFRFGDSLRIMKMDRIGGECIAHTLDKQRAT